MKLAAMEANRPDSDPLSLNTDIAHLYIALPDAWHAFMPSAFDAVRAKVMGLELHLRHTIKLGRFRDRASFGKKFVAVCEGIVFTWRRG